MKIVFILLGFFLDKELQHIVFSIKPHSNSVSSKLLEHNVTKNKIQIIRYNRPLFLSRKILLRFASQLWY